MSLMPFHLAIPVHDLPAARRFYGEVFGLSEGRPPSTGSTSTFRPPVGHPPAPADRLPAPRRQQPGGRPRRAGAALGVVLAWDDWHALAERLQQRGTRFVIEPYIRFKGQVGEQATLFLFDPCGNALEFKSFRDMGQLFAK